MLQIVKENPKAAAAALLMHLVIILFLIVGVDWLETPKPVESGVEVVQARMVEQLPVPLALEERKQKQAEQLAEQKKREEEAALDAERKEREAEQESRRKAELEQQRIAEAARSAEEEKRRKAEEKKQREAEATRKAEKEKKLEAEKEKRRKAEEKKKREAEAARKAEEEKKRRAEAARKAEEEKKRKAEAARKAREAELEAAMEAEHNARVRDRFMLQIQQKVVGNWVRLDGTGEGLKCKLRVRLARGGNVLAVSVIESSGSGSFDRSAEAAVYKADPLPVPEDQLFEQFRDIIFVFDPNR